MNRLRSYWTDSLNLLLGVWLFVSAWVLGFAEIPAALWNALIFGAVLMILTIATLMEWRDWEEWGELAAGAWLVAAPWVLGFGTLTGGGPAWLATVNTAGVGLVVAALAAWSLWAHRGDPHVRP